MADAPGMLNRLGATPREAIQWACVLEATAPKVGNVYPGRRFADLTHTDFITAAEITAHHLTSSDQPMSARMLSAVTATADRVGSNVNLGIVLLLGPLVAADTARDGESGERGNRWRPAIASYIDSLDGGDGQTIYKAISAASPGGLGETESNDVRSITGPVDIVAAMTQAAQRDRVARQYATRYADLLDHVVPVVQRAIVRQGDLLDGISQAHLELLAQEPDSLIARKCGQAFALQVRDRAAQINIDDRQQVERFDQWLRSDGHRRNPGTTADLIAASLYLILRNYQPSN